MKHKSIFISLSTLLVAVLLANGCATDKGTLSPEYRYGNPDYRHVRDLPQNRPVAKQTGRLPAPEAPMLTGDEYEVLGDAWLKQKNYPLAYLQYAKSLGKDPDNSRVECKIGMMYLAAGKLDHGIEQFQTLIDRSPGNAAAWEGLGQAVFLKKDYNSAEKYFLKALSINHRLWKSHSFLGYIHDTRRDHTGAIVHYRSALAVKPGCGSVYNNLGVSYSMIGRFPEAVEAFNAAVAHQYAHKKVFNNLALALAHSGKYTEALQVFKRGVTPSLAYNNLGIIHLNAGNYGQAIRYFETAMELNPRFNARVSRNLKIARTEKMRTETRHD